MSVSVFVQLLAHLERLCGLPYAGFVLCHWQQGIILQGKNWIFYSTKCILYPYQDKTRDIRSNIALRLREFPMAKPRGTSEGKGVYLTAYPKSSPNTDSI